MKPYIRLLALLLLVSSFVYVGMYSTTEASKKSNPGRIIRIEPYACGMDVCAGYRCVGDIPLTNGGISVSPACYNATELSQDTCRNGVYRYIPDFSLMCHEASYYYVWTAK